MISYFGLLGHGKQLWRNRKAPTKTEFSFFIGASREENRSFTTSITANEKYKAEIRPVNEFTWPKDLGYLVLKRKLD
ncbi:hypothetical protein BES34_008355 [Leptospira inadai serovar Lyme]|uniref:Uncharacterized protein n=1 Tax=Leptospira inadai serovar Lyme TaxID=293084 RepID=A0ABX4YK18_9LEPT|nr:hypothetical protein BES34_008355 [Leptospira inadai serovar Lyme]